MADEAPAPETVDTADSEEFTGVRDGKRVMRVKVYAPFQVYFEGEAYSLSAENATGPFDILPKHKNFLCMLVPCQLKVSSPAGEKTIKIHRALMHVKADYVAVFVDV